MCLEYAKTGRFRRRVGLIGPLSNPEFLEDLRRLSDYLMDEPALDALMSTLGPSRAGTSSIRPLLFHVADGEIEKFGHTPIDDPVMDVAAVSSSPHNAPVGQPLELVGNSLWRHAYVVGERAYGEFAGAVYLVKHPKPSLVREGLEKSLEREG